MILDRKAILAVNDLVTKTVNVPEWKGDVIIRTMTGSERDAFESSLIEGRGDNKQANMKNLRAKLLASCLIDESGKRLFSEKDIGDLGGKSAKALDRLYTVARDLNGIGAEDEEELVKNSDSEGNVSSTSSSRES